MKTSLRTLLLLTALGAGSTSQLAHADFLGALKNAATQELGTQKAAPATDASALSGLLSGNTSSLTPATASNAAGLIQFCIKNNVLSAANADNVKNQLLGKLGIQTEQPKNDPDYLDGLKGVLHGQGTGNIDLNNLGGGVSKLKEQVTEKACDIVLDQAKSYL
jgi:hypothetical protein